MENKEDEPKKKTLTEVCKDYWNDLEKMKSKHDKEGY